MCEFMVVDRVRLAHVSQRSRESHGEMAIELVFAAECEPTSLRRCSRRMPRRRIPRHEGGVRHARFEPFEGCETWISRKLPGDVVRLRLCPGAFCVVHCISEHSIATLGTNHHGWECAALRTEREAAGWLSVHIAHQPFDSAFFADTQEVVSAQVPHVGPIEHLHRYTSRGQGCPCPCDWANPASPNGSHQHRLLKDSAQASDGCRGPCRAMTGDAPSLLTRSGAVNGSRDTRPAGARNHTSHHARKQASTGSCKRARTYGPTLPR